MSVHFTLYVEDNAVGQVVVTRNLKGVLSQNVHDDWRAFEYNWECRQYSPVEKISRGRVFHTPREGVWALIGKVGAHVNR